MAWREAVCNGREWTRDRDATRFRQAFVNLESTIDRWPQPKHFLEAMPRLEVRAIERHARPASDEQAKAALQAIGKMLGALPEVHRPVPKSARETPLSAVEQELKQHYRGKQ